MVNIQYLSSDDPVPEERHVAVIVHGDAPLENQDKAYFYDSAEKDFGGSGPFDWRLDEAIDRAKNTLPKRKSKK